MTTHLIATTIVAFIAVCLALLLRRRSAALRHAILLAALVGFALPTPLLNRAGDKLAACLASPQAPSFFGFEAMHFPSIGTLPAPNPPSHLVRNALWTLWALVFALSLGTWLRRLLRSVPSVREPSSVETEALLRAQASLDLRNTVRLCITTADRVPGALGVLRPCVVLPDRLSEQLSEAELHAVLAHELAHIARRDNLSAVVARVIVSVFWFHPLTWWIERRMLAEREGACDELVLAHGAEASDYVSAILKVCRMPFADAHGYAGATGSNLPHRMEQIMSAHIAHRSSRFLRAIPVGILALAAMLPVGKGFLQGQDVAAPVAAKPTSTTHSSNDAAVQRAYDCFLQHNYPEAENLYRQLYILDPEDHRGLVGLAETYIAEGRQNDAIQSMQQEVSEHPDQKDLRIYLANLEVRTEQYNAAIAEYQQLLATAKTPNERADLLFKLGEANRRRGDLNTAIQYFKAASDADPKRVDALVQLALLFDGTGRPEQAVFVYEQVLKLAPDNAIALNNLAYLKAEKGIDLDSALALAQKAAQAAKNSPEIEDTLGWAYLKKNQPDQAIEAFRTALQAAPNNPKFHYHLGLALLPIGERDAAIQELRTALSELPSTDDEKEIRKLLDKIAPNRE